MADDSRNRVWNHLQPLLEQSTTLEAYLHAVADSTAELIGVDGSYSLCSTVYGRPFTIGTSDREAWQADQVEFDTEDGPCVQALRTGTVTDAIHLADERRWPTWSAVAILLGFESAAGVVAEDSSGQRLALNLYAPAPRAFDEASLQRAQLFVEEVARSIPAALRIFAAAERAHHLEQALVSRSTIDQAIGVLMVQNQCTAEAAFGLLRRASQNHNLKLREIAATIIERYTGHPASPPPPFGPATPPRSARPARQEL